MQEAVEEMDDYGDKDDRKRLTLDLKRLTERPRATQDGRLVNELCDRNARICRRK